MAAQGQQGSPSTSASAKTAPEPSLQVVAEEYQRQVERFNASGSAQLLSRLFEEELELFPNNTITRIVCLGLNRITARMTWQGPRERSNYEQSTAPFHQFVFMTLLLDLLKKRHNITEVILQDPAFKEVEIAFFESLGFKVLRDPQAYFAVDAETFVYGPRFPRDLIIKFIGMAFPAVFIGENLNEAITFTQATNQGPAAPHLIEQLAKFRDAMRERPMSNFDNEHWCRGTSIYWNLRLERQEPSLGAEELEAEEEGSPPAEGGGRQISDIPAFGERPRSRGRRIFDLVAGPAHKRP